MSELDKIMAALIAKELGPTEGVNPLSPLAKSCEPQAYSLAKADYVVVHMSQGRPIVHTRHTAEALDTMIEYLDEVEAKTDDVWNAMRKVK